ncbi:MAG TPA: aminotransferase class III-fold pyridoxal phosphate-dependent enzyme, partial [Thermoanaerobaculia bacterium]|nr:aminotransferase class III-fold pyridoxal phosphate-dependent enzyme [Thermoanaerobaculia bacterium]
MIRNLARYEAPLVNTVVGGNAYPPWAEARGANVLDVDGNRYIDLSAGFGAAVLGHRHAAIVAAVEGQTHRLIHGLGDVAAHPGRVELARRLSRFAPVSHRADDPRQVYFAVSGADAVEVAIKTAILHHHRPAIVAFDPAYHGSTLGALAATSRPAFRAPFAAQLNPHVARLPYACDPAQLDDLLAARHDIAAVLLEPIAGREGVLVPSPGWLAAVARVCHA